MIMNMDLMGLYDYLLDAYGPQGWWPLLDHNGSNPTKTGAHTGYHPGDYSFPKNAAQRYEICLGAILTQNTAWVNVEKSLVRFHNEVGFVPSVVCDLKIERLAEIIRSSGYYNQKSKKFCLKKSFRV